MLGGLAFGPPIILVDGDKGVPATEADFEMPSLFKNQNGDLTETISSEILHTCKELLFL